MVLVPESLGGSQLTLCRTQCDNDLLKEGRDAILAEVEDGRVNAPKSEAETRRGILVAGGAAEAVEPRINLADEIDARTLCHRESSEGRREECLAAALEEGDPTEARDPAIHS